MGKGNRDRWKSGEVAQALRDASGFVSVAADRLGCTTQTIRNYINRYPTVAQAKEEARERTKDRVEGMLLKNIMSGNVTAQIFYLKTQAKDRGYTDRVEISGDDIKVDVTFKNALEKAYSDSSDESATE